MTSSESWMACFSMWMRWRSAIRRFWRSTGAAFARRWTAFSPTVRWMSSRLAAEVILYADKICTDEETVRLRSHIEGMKAELIQGGSIGRKLLISSPRR